MKIQNDLGIWYFSQKSNILKIQNEFKTFILVFRFLFKICKTGCFNILNFVHKRIYLFKRVWTFGSPVHMRWFTYGM